MGLAVSCPRCGGPVRPPGLAHSHWLCPDCGPIAPLFTAAHVNLDVIEATAARAARTGLPVWCTWPLPLGWTVTGLAWAGDDRAELSATVVALSGPTPLGDGPADMLLVSEEPGVGLGTRLAGLTGPDPGPALTTAQSGTDSRATVKAAGRTTPLWSVAAPEDRSAYVGEAMGRWIYAVVWPAHAGYLLAEEIVLHDLGEWMPPELVFGAPSPHLPVPA